MGGIGLGSVLGWSTGAAAARRLGVAVLIIAAIASALAVNWLAGGNVAGATVMACVSSHAIREVVHRVLHTSAATHDTQEAGQR